MRHNKGIIQENIVFKNEHHIGEKCCVLFVVGVDVYGSINRNFVEDKLNPEGYFKHFFCNEIEVSIVKVEELRVRCSGCRYQNIYFVGRGFCGEDIEFCHSRLHPHIKMYNDSIDTPND